MAKLDLLYHWLYQVAPRKIHRTGIKKRGVWWLLSQKVFVIIPFVFWVYYIRHWRPGDRCQRTHMAWDLAKIHELNRDCASKICHVKDEMNPHSWWNLQSLHRFSKGTNVFGRVLPIQIVLYIDKSPNPSKTYIYILYIYVCVYIYTYIVIVYWLIIPASMICVYIHSKQTHTHECPIGSSYACI